MADYTPVAEIPVILDDLRKTFRSGRTKPIQWRRQQLLHLSKIAKENADALAECIRLDLGKPKQEVIMAEVVPIMERSLICAEKVAEWVKPEELTVPPRQQSWKPRVEKHAKGVVLIIGPWNYPMMLSLQPLYGAISAGCCAVIKPSELAPHYASFLARTLAKYLDSSAYRVVLGGVPETTRLLELKWDHIFYTGNGRIARIISAAAAKHLTPLTLELGGKSPVLIDASADISLSAKRVLWGKINACGQICVAPDYILAEKAIVPELVEKLKEHYAAFFPEGALASESYSRIVSDAHFERLIGLLGRTKGKIVLGGKWEEEGKGKVEGKRGIEPTVVVDVEKGDALLEDELFGPILPIVAMENVDEAIAFVNERDHPLVLYAFSNDENVKKKIITNTMSGTVCFGDTFSQISLNEAPFGGIGESGYGRQVLKYSFDNFVYERPIIDVPFEDEKFLGARYPPYTAESLDFMSAPIKVAIPEA